MADIVTNLQIVLDCADPHAQAEFWAAALGGYRLDRDPAFVQRMLDEGHASPDDVVERDGQLLWRDGDAMVDEAGQRPRWYFQKVPEEKAGKNRMHIDLHVGAEAKDETVARLEGLGATRLYEGTQGPHAWVTLADPEGNELCVG